jgi:hypothetical protein
MKKSKRKFRRKCIRALQSRLYFHLSETEHVELNRYVKKLSKHKKPDKGNGKGNSNNFFSAN